MREHIYKFFHYNDPTPDSRRLERWQFVYLRAMAEQHNAMVADHEGWRWAPTDMFWCDEPMPTSPGKYQGDLYGMRVVAIIDYTQRGYWGGHVAAVDDPVGMAHHRGQENGCDQQ